MGLISSHSEELLIQPDKYVHSIFFTKTRFGEKNKKRKNSEVKCFLDFVILLYSQNFFIFFTQESTQKHTDSADKATQFPFPFNIIKMLTRITKLLQPTSFTRNQTSI